MKLSQNIKPTRELPNINPLQIKTSIHDMLKHMLKVMIITNNQSQHSSK